MLTQQQLEALLGRSLTSTETNNISLYLDIAQERLEQLLCFELFDNTESGAEPEVRKFQSRDGYSTLFVDPFTTIDSVEIGGEVVEDYTEQQFNNLNGDWFNSLVFDHKLSGEVVEVTALWGFAGLPNDLASLLAQLFGLVSKKQKSTGNVQSKQVEDFRVTFRDVTLDDQFMKDYAGTIAKYSLCGVGEVRHGRIGVRPFYFR